MMFIVEGLIFIAVALLLALIVVKAVNFFNGEE